MKINGPDQTDNTHDGEVKQSVSRSSDSSQTGASCKAYAAATIHQQTRQNDVNLLRDLLCSGMDLPLEGGGHTARANCTLIKTLHPWLCSSLLNQFESTKINKLIRLRIGQCNKRTQLRDTDVQACKISPDLPLLFSTEAGEHCHSLCQV